MLENKEIAAKFQLLGKLMELHGENSFKAKSYETAAFRLKRLDASLADMSAEARAALPGVGAAIQAKIAELLDRGTLAALETLLEKTPSGVVDMLRIKGLGAKKVGTIWRELNVESLGELLYACRENRLAMLKGFGEKTQAQVIANIEFLQSQSGLFHYATLEEPAQALCQALAAFSDRVEETGALRRRTIVLDTVELVVEDKAGLEKELLESSWLEDAEIAPLADDFPFKGNCRLLKAITPQGVPVKLYLTKATDLEAVWFYTSAAAPHRAALPPNINLEAGDETAIYTSAGLDWIAPELREGRNEIQLAKTHALPDLLCEEDIRGAVHNHSKWSDGGSTIEAMAKACIAKGYEYLVMSDHSRTAVYAGGLSIERVEAQAREIDQLNEQLAPFRIFKSIESDILADGSLDYPDDVLAQFDLVIASVHSGLKMDQEKATERILRAVENPYTTILGHPTGRLLLSRPGYPLDHERIIRACAQQGVVIELNANPWRLDLDWTWIPAAREAGVMISINPDAHSLDGLNDIHFGVLAARKGGLTAEGTWNAKNLAGIEQWLQQRKDSLAIRLGSSKKVSA